MPHRVALFVDSENVSSTHASTILGAARARGVLTIARAYGDVARQPVWSVTPGLQVVHTQSGRNCADMAIAIDAVDLHARGLFDTAVIATSDTDFSRLATHLRERGAEVLGLGEAKAPELLRAARTSFQVLSDGRDTPLREPAAPKSKVADLLCSLLAGQMDGMTIVSLNAAMWTGHRIKMSSLPEKRWRPFLESHPDLFMLDPKGQNARVRLRRKPDPKCKAPDRCRSGAALPKVAPDQFGISPEMPST